jgi:glycosyltransferase involved in cell wall biosynthesis
MHEYGMTPLVSVVMPVRNGARWLDEAIDSIARQTLSDLELLIVDDGSTDETPQILDDWSHRDSRIRVLRQTDCGLAAALNYGLAEARGRYLARLDADDCAMPARLERQVGVLQQNPSIGLLGSWAERIDEYGRPQAQLKPETQPDKLADIIGRANPFVHSSVMLRPEIARDLGGYRAAFEAAEDYDLWLRMSEITRLGNIGEPAVFLDTPRPTRDVDPQGDR